MDQSWYLIQLDGLHSQIQGSFGSADNTDAKNGLKARFPIRRSSKNKR